MDTISTVKRLGKKAWMEIVEIGEKLRKWINKISSPKKVPSDRKPSIPAETWSCTGCSQANIPVENVTCTRCGAYWHCECGTVNPVSVIRCSCNAHWRCPECGSCSPAKPSGAGCLNCGWTELQKIVLSGDTGRELAFSISTIVSQSLLKNISSGGVTFADANKQFELRVRNAKWFLIANPTTKNATLVNGAPVADEIPLNNGDEICLGSRTGSGKTALTINVKI